MKRITMRLLAILLVASAAGSGAPAAEKRKPTTRPATAAPATRPAASTAPATRPAKTDNEDVIPKALLDAARNSFVVVQVWYKKDTTDSPDVQERDWRIRQIYEDCIDKKRPEERVGIVLDGAGDVLVADDGVEDRFIDRIVVQDISGAAFPAKRDRLLFDAPGVVLKVDAEGARKLKPLKFADLKDQGLNTRILQAILTKSDDKWRLSARPVYSSVDFAPGAVGNVFYGADTVMHRYSEYDASPVILSDPDGSPVGCALASFMDLRQSECKWRGADLLSARGMSWSQFAAAQEKVRKQWIDAVQEVVLTLRQGTGGEEDYGQPRSRFTGSGGGAEGREFNAYGVAIGPQEILVPLALTREIAGTIDKIYVKFSPTDRRRAEFVGAYKDFGAFVVRLQKDKLPAHVQPAKDDPPAMKPFLVVNPRKRFGSKYVDLTSNRVFGKTRGYAGKYHWYPARSISPGEFLADFEGNLAGIYMKQRLENEEERQIERTDRYSGSEQQNRVFTISEIREDLADPNAHMDKEIAVKTRTEAKRRPWFGVEYVGMTSDLAEHFKVEKPTKDGELGFVVNAVYPDSPAAKAGIRVGDILLRVEAPGLPNPIELASRLTGEGGDYRSSRRFGGGTGEDETEEEMGPVEPTWKSRRNFLTFALDKIKIGRKITVTYYRHDGKGKGEGETLKLDYTIEQAPPDFDSAPKWKNRKVGLTVKDMTYEVRHALGLRNDDPGVIVANIEPGSAARVAKIYPNEIVTRLNDEPLKSARQMRDLIAKAHKAGQQKVRLAILRLGKTRFADLAVGSYDPADDEGLDED